MQGERDDEAAGCFPAGGGGGKGKAPSPPPPPPSHEIDGGHRRGLVRRRRRWRPVRGEVFAVGFMVAAAAYFLLVDALAVGRDPADGDDPSGGWFFAAYMLWITGLNLLYVLDYLMN